MAGTMLLLIDKLDTSIFTIRALLLREIRDNRLYENHPNEYKSPAEMFTDITGRYMSQGEYSDATAWVELCLPILAKMGYSEEDLNAWGTAKIRAVVPIFRALTGDREATKSTQESIQYVKESIGAKDGEIEIMAEVARLATTEQRWRDFTLALGKDPPAVTLIVRVVPGGYKIETFITEEEWLIIKQRMGNQLIIDMIGGNSEASKMGT